MVQYTGSVQDYMTPGPHAIGAHESVESARELMDRYTIRHLPVLGGDGKCVGVLSDRDIKLAKTLPQPEASQLDVSDIMDREPLQVSPTSPLTQTAREMANRRLGCAVVTDRDTVVGILTTTDALFALIDALEGKHVRSTYDREIANAPQRGRTRPLTQPLGSRRGGE